MCVFYEAQFKLAIRCGSLLALTAQVASGYLAISKTGKTRLAALYLVEIEEAVISRAEVHPLKKRIIIPTWRFSDHFRAHPGANVSSQINQPMTCGTPERL